MAELTFERILVFVAFVLPGFISMRVYALLHPSDEFRLKDQLFEAIGFSIVNISVTFWFVRQLQDPVFIAANPAYSSIVAFCSLFLVPVLLAVIAFHARRLLAEWRLILQPYKTAWDEFFIRREPCWIIVHLKDGRRLGGWFGAKSFATLFPASGHIYIQQLWKLTDDSQFLEPVPRSKGVLLRPDDYHFLEFLGDERKEHAKQQ